MDRKKKIHKILYRIICLVLVILLSLIIVSPAYMEHMKFKVFFLYFMIFAWIYTDYQKEHFPDLKPGKAEKIFFAILLLLYLLRITFYYLI